MISGTVPGSNPRNGLPGPAPYRWRDPDAGRDAEVQRMLAAIRAEAAGDVLDGPSPGDYREAADLPWSPPSPAPAPIVPYAVNGRRHPQPGIVPRSLAARLAPPPTPKTAARRCRRCGYLRAHCSCTGRSAAA